MAIRIGFHGGVSTTTGTCFLLEYPAGRLLIDCGLFMGTRTVRALNRRELPFSAARLDAVLVTHAHVDHAGLLPRLLAEGLRAPIMTTEPTLALLSALLPATAAALTEESERLNRRGRRRGRPDIEPLYREEDAQLCLARMEACDYGRWFEPAPGARARFWDAGHIPGSASIELEVEDETGRPVRFLFSGDLGPEAASLAPSPWAPSHFDYLVVESLCGDRTRTDATPEQRRRRLLRAIREALEGDGIALVPVLGLERTSELLDILVDAMQRGELPQIPLLFACERGERLLETLTAWHPGAVSAGARRERVQLCAALASTLARDGGASALKGPLLLLAAAPTGEAGPARRALLELLWRPEVTVLFLGHQPAGSLGQVILSGEKRLRVDGEELWVRARVRALESVFGHADRDELVRWVAARRPITQAIFLVRGSECATTALRAALAAQGFDPLAILVPHLDQRFELARGTAPRPLPGPTRIDPRFAAVAADWHNAHARLLLDIADELRVLPDDRSRLELLGRLRRTLRS